MSTATAVRPEIADAIAEIRFDTEFPFSLEIVSSEGKSQILPMESGYAITVDEETTEDEILDLEPLMARIARTVDRIWPF